MEEFDHSLPMILNRALDSVLPPYREIFLRYDLTEPQWRILRVVWTGEKIKSVDLASRTLLAPASIVGIIDRLEKKGLVSRVRSTSDRRAVYITATTESRKLQEEVSPKIAAIQKRMKSLVSVEDWDHMEQTLVKISYLLNNELPADMPEATLENRL